MVWNIVYSTITNFVEQMSTQEAVEMQAGTPKVEGVPGRDEYNTDLSPTERPAYTGTYGVLMYLYWPVLPNICVILGGGTKGGRIFSEFWDWGHHPTQLPYWDSWQVPELMGNASAGILWRLYGNAINIDGGGRTGGFSLTNLRSLLFLMG